MARKVALFKIWDGDTLIDLQWNNSTPADSGIPTQEEKEFFRIFQEHKQLQAKRPRAIKTLEWMVADAKYRFDECKNNLEEGSSGGYSPELTEAIDLLAELKGSEK